jgi:hypothetical protein
VGRSQNLICSRCRFAGLPLKITTCCGSHVVPLYAISKPWRICPDSIWDILVRISLYISSPCGPTQLTAIRTTENLLSKMANHARPQMCLSTESHDNRVLNVTRHYFGCLRDSERQHFYSQLPEKSQRRICREARRIKQLRATLEYQPETTAGSLLKDFKECMNNWRAVNGWMSREASGTPIFPNDPGDDAEGEIKAPMIFFKNSRPYDIPGVENSFPNQKIPIKILLADEPEVNPLMQPCDDNMVRYFHLPANNMIWVEVSHANSRYGHS